MFGFYIILFKTKCGSFYAIVGFSVVSEILRTEKVGSPLLSQQVQHRFPQSAQVFECLM